MIPLSEASKILKNSMFDDGVWLWLYTFRSPDGSITEHLINNTENITYNGVVYTKFPIQIASITESNKGELPLVDISISNVDRVMEGYIENDPDLGSGWSVHIDIVHQSALNSPAEMTYDFITMGAKAQTDIVTFSCGIRNPIRAQFPRLRMLPNSCQNTFKKGGCTYSGTDTTCSKTLQACRDKFQGSTKLPFLGYPGIPGEAVYV